MYQAAIIIILCMNCVTSNMSEYLNKIKHIYFNNNKKTLGIIQMSNDDQLLTTFLQQVRLPIQISDIKQTYTRTQEKPAYIVIFLNTKSVLKLKSFRNNLLWERDALILIVLTDTEDFHTAKNVLEMFWNYTKSLNINILLQNLISYTWFPFLCDEHSKFQLTNSLFTNKLPHIYECTSIHVVVRIVPPSVVVGHPLMKYGEGHEFKLLKTVTDAHNITLVHEIIPPQNMYDPSQFPNGTYGFPYRRIQSGDADVFLGGNTLYDPPYLIFDILPLNIEDKLVFVVPPPELKPRWMSLIRPLSSTVWLVSMLFCILLCVLYLMTGIIVNEKCNVLTVYGIIFEAGVDIQYRTQLMKCVTCLIIIFSLLITTGYKSSIIKVLIQPDFYPKYESVQQLLEQQVTIQLIPAFYNFYNSKPIKVPWEEEMLKHSDISLDNLDDVSSRIASTRNLATVRFKTSTELFINAFYLDNKGKAKLDMFSESKVGVPIVHHASLTTPFYKLLRSQYAHILEGGLIDFWYKQFLQKCKKISGSVGDENIRLSLEHIQSVFYILIVGYLCGSVLFLCEHIIKYYNQKTVNRKKASATEFAR